MVQCPDSLVWQIVGRNNCFQKKVNGHTKRSGCTIFSAEKGNLASISSFKFSGLANSKAVDISATSDNTTVISVKTSKSSTYPRKAQASSGANKCFKRSSATVKSLVANNYYRRDLEAAALAKYSKVYQANRISKKVRKSHPSKLGRK
mmetsp:Transcript_22033/g.21178  ORF Transcript_22033/g.21178 Transcript_22033/m.21178 type:complete len:148 (-) Transcript_22033:50-493(-)|eukprot:CAMPEP_0197840190 /NCGR_PEP_ID=MMETSP1437-20131217/45457_1 /TAXON_ID=49252 ORGANISM="Eucampia antarctica, Strain CCMP1452" /NCGR_SAMPLE_ID=MMETSP1437 /ASSEMBLY_ACC=CAM_ASM_001096 /LENGTH=147 /DNA_ID=CAMNT_0043449755 /DNA_START=670 /DNA_END=1113 /DNA_ORIENTATION=+